MSSRIFAIGPCSDTDGADLVHLYAVVVPHAGAEVRGEDRRDEADAECDCEALYRPRAELEEDEPGEKRRHVGIDDGGKRPLVAGFDGPAHGLAGAQLLTDALVD